VAVSQRLACSISYSFRVFLFVWLTMHPNRMIVYFHYQLVAQILYYTPLHVSSTIMLIFRRTNCIIQHVVSSLFLGDCSVHRLREDSRNLCTEQSPKESDGTRCCTVFPQGRTVVRRNPYSVLAVVKGK